MEKFEQIVSNVDSFVWGPVMLVLLVGTGIFLTIRTRALSWRNLGYALKKTLSKEARTKGRGEGDVSPFSALTTALAATIGTGNIVGVATAMVSGGPGALVWMWISACFGLTSKFSECMLAIKYREVNEKGEMSGGPMYTMKKGIKNKKLGSIMGWLFAFFAVVASFGIGNLTQANSIASSMNETFGIPTWVIGVIITALALLIIVGGIKTISKVSSVVVPFMAIFYVIAGLIVILGNISNVPSGIAMIFSMAFNVKSVTGGILGTVVASMMSAMRYGVARGVFSNEAGMGSAAITAAAATTDNPVRQGYINMTGTFWDTIVVCTITGIVIASSGALGNTHVVANDDYAINGNTIVLEDFSNGKDIEYEYRVSGENVVLTDKNDIESVLTPYVDEEGKTMADDAGDNKADLTSIQGTYKDGSGHIYKFYEDGSYAYEELYTGSALTIQAFKTVLGGPGGWLVCISIALFAFSTILGWEYHGEKAFEYILGTHKYNIIYRVLFSLIAYIGATTALDLVWNLSDIANALMAIPNLICMLLLSGEIAKDMKEFQKEIEKEKN
ncbi:MAG: sodium:alanine symporter family protein [Lachnospiraceae bacterium]|nr:sodium:alanine symporter family protein [Lachnospiraceae bacterium]